MQTPPNASKVVARPEGDPGRAHDHRSTKTPGGATTAEQKPLDRSVADPTRLVTTITDTLRTLRGQVVTVTVAVVLAELLRLDVPWMSMVQIGELVAPPIAMGCVLDDQTINERARNLAVVALYGDR
jgi:hypothetical protein